MRSELSRRAVLAMVFALGAASVGCTLDVRTPNVRPRDLQFTGVSPQGLTFRVVFDTYNSNSFTLDLRDLRAHLWLDGQDIGAGVNAVRAQLPPGRWVPVNAEVTVPWNGAPGALLGAGGAPMVNYTIRGEVTVEHYLSIRAPFETSGTVPRQFFMRGAANTLNNVVNQVLPGVGIQVQ